MTTSTWRKEYGADQLLNTFSLSDEQREKCWSCYEFGFHHTDKRGNPIWIDRVGNARLNVLKKQITREDFLRWRGYLLEYTC